MRVLGSLVVLSLLLALEPAGPARAAESTSLAMEAPTTYGGEAAALSVTLASAGTPLPAAAITLERKVDGTWTQVAVLTTDESGTATRDLLVHKDPADNAVRATFAGDDAHEPQRTTFRLPLRQRTGHLTIDAPKSVVDERSARIAVTWTARDGEPVVGEEVLLQRKVGRHRWDTKARLKTGSKGSAATRVRPREDSRWRARAHGVPWVSGDVTKAHFIDNLPPGIPVRLPAAAPSPRRHLPPQRHAVGDGPHPVITGIPAGVWRQMTGVSWHAGCPVGRAGLRLLHINYWDYQGYRRRGELVAAAGAIGRMAAALADLYRHQLPIRAMYRVDRFGWSSYLHGGNDYASMAAGNTSAFNCRGVTGNPAVLSPHAYGRAIDLNTWENPYRSARGLVPDAWWQGHSHPRVAWRSYSHAVVRIMARHGLRWTYGLRDTQHFDAVTGSGRVLVVPGCEHVVCD